MYCWSCGHQQTTSDSRCERCGAPPAQLPSDAFGHHGIRVCPGCGYRGDGVPYFRRASHLALLTGAALLTYGIGGLAYWLIKREDRVCPSCGLSWKRSRPVGSALPPSADERPGQASTEASGGGSSRQVARSGAGGGEGKSEGEGRSRRRPVPMHSRSETPLPRAGTVRRFAGVFLALLSVLLLGIGLVQGEAGAAVMSLFLGLTGAASFGWGWSARQQRREAILRRMQGRILHLARVRGGTLTATDVASELDLSLDGAERVLLSLDDGLRVRSDVTRDGILVFEFPEIRWGAKLSADPDRRRALEWTRELEESREAAEDKAGETAEAGSTEAEEAEPDSARGSRGRIGE